MGYQIRMAPEVQTWLAEVRHADPAVADRIEEAVAALRAGGKSTGPPLVVAVDDPAGRRAASMPGRRTVLSRGGLPARMRLPRGGKPPSGAARWLPVRTGSRRTLSGLDAAYQRQLATLGRMRGAVAAVATSRRRLELQVGQVQQQVVGLGGQHAAGKEAGQADIADERRVSRGPAERQLADLRRQYAAIQAKEERIIVASRRLQAKLDAFRADKNAAEAAYTAVEYAAQAAWDEVTGNTGAHAQSAGPDADEAKSAGLDGPAQAASWLRELRPGAPESTGTRILFTVEPSGTAVLLAAGMENDWLQAWYAEAVTLCRIRYQREHGSTD
jgi:phage shock protein A